MGVEYVFMPSNTASLCKQKTKATPIMVVIKKAGIIKKCFFSVYLIIGNQVDAKYD